VGDGPGEAVEGGSHGVGRRRELGRRRSHGVVMISIRRAVSEGSLGEKTGGSAEPANEAIFFSKRGQGNKFSSLFAGATTVISNRKHLSHRLVLALRVVRVLSAVFISCVTCSCRSRRWATCKIVRQVIWGL
jgi:hypothetical protein